MFIKNTFYILIINFELGQKTESVDLRLVKIDIFINHTYSNFIRRNQNRLKNASSLSGLVGRLVRGFVGLMEQKRESDKLGKGL